MAATSTNKQPLLVDHVLHEVVDLKGAVVAQGGGVEIGSANSAALIVDSTSADGCIIESIYAISRTEAYTIKLYLSTANDYLRTQQSVYIGQFRSTLTDAGKITEYEEMPKILAPVPADGGEAQLRALYIPKGKALWAAVEITGDAQAENAPLLGVQGGWY